MESPTGCGKSTILSQMMDLFRKNSRNWLNISKPAVIISLRSLGNTKEVNSVDRSEIDLVHPKAINPVTRNALSGESDLMATASKIFKAIGYPSKTSMLDRFFGYITELNIFGAKMKLSSCKQTTYQVNEALDLLFDCLSDLNGFAAIDEAHDLIRDDRLALVGGQEIFRNLARLAVDHAVNLPKMKVAFAGSSNFLWFDLNKTVLSGHRLNMKYVDDIQEATVISYLSKEFNMSLEKATFLVEACGSRLRLVLKCAACKDPNRQLDDIYEESLGHITIFYNIVQQHSELRDATSKIANGEKFTLYNLPRDLWKVEKFSQVIYVGSGSRLIFQNRIIEELWKRHFPK